jgi:hypothetical protein
MASRNREFRSPSKALRDAGAGVEVLSPEGGEVQAMRHDEKSIRIQPDGRIRMDAGRL